MLPFRVFSQTNLVGTGRPSSLNPRPVNLLQPLVQLPKSQLLYNQADPASFCKTPGVGVPLRKLARYTEVQKCLLVSPLFATLTHSVSRKSFACHSYENTRDGAPQCFSAESPFRPHMCQMVPLSPMASVDCAYFPSRRGCTTPARFRFFCVCGKPNWLVLCFHTRLPRSARGTNPFSRNSFLFTSIQNPRECGGPAICDVPADIQVFGKEGRCVRLSRSRRKSSPRSSRSA